MMTRNPAFTVVRLALLVLCSSPIWSPADARGEPTPAQEVYWWQDEIRTAGWAASRMRTGGVSQWPQMSVPAGSATMPLPRATSAVQADGNLDEAAWKHATSFPVGPIFDAWRQGPFMLQLSACRDDKNVYLAIESPRDLTGLGALTLEGELFAVGGKKYHVGTGGGLPEQSVKRRGEGQVIELALPLGGDVAMSFAVETVRHTDGKLPPGSACLGLRKLATSAGGRSDFRKPTLWLEPIIVHLLPADTAVQVSASAKSPTEMRLSWQVIEANKEAGSGVLDLAATEDPSVYPYSWKAAVEGKSFAMEGFLYLESIAKALATARKMAERAAALGSTKLGAAPSLEQMDALQSEMRKLSPQDRKAWRALYCCAREVRARVHLSMLDAPLLFVKRRPYFANHIYDDYYPWHPGGGIYVLEEPHSPRLDSKVRTLVDPTTNETPGEGVYRDPDVSWKADRVLFAHKGPERNTSIYEIGIDGRGLRRLTDPACDCTKEVPAGRRRSSQHDITPCYLPDGCIAFTSTRPGAIVPCNNTQVATLHTMNADGSDIRSISVNNVNDFDPAVMPDGRILFGRWEYVDKTAMYVQSLWTVSPDGRMEESWFANNLARPTALLDARPVPGSNRVIASLTPHFQAVGAIATIDTRHGKNNLKSVVNFTPEYPVQMGQGLYLGPSDPWPLSEDDVIITNNAVAAHAIIELIDRFGNRELVHCDPAISCYAPMLVKARINPPVISPDTTRDETGRFLVVDIYEGLQGVPRGAIRRLRVVEETARTSGTPGGFWNQTFPISWQGAYVAKNFLGTVPVHEDGSAYFEVSAGRAVYFEALDAEGRGIQRMRTFVQAAPGATRSCIGCHENKRTAPVRPGAAPLAMLGPPDKPQPESWGSGFVDYPTMIQPILDKHCVRCHGGQEGMAVGIDLSGGCTWAFNISYETLIKNRLVGLLNCHDLNAHSCEILPPRTIGSGAAPLAELLISGHDGRIQHMTRKERDLILAWMDTNSNYHGSWDYTQYITCQAILNTRGPLCDLMQAAGCTECHEAGHIGNDWVNLHAPEWSRILRAPMAESEGGLGLAMCRKRKARTGYRLLDQGVQPPDVFKTGLQPEWNPGGRVHTTFTSTNNPHFQAMLTVIRHAQTDALTRPRVDMPGADIIGGVCRMQVFPPVPDAPPALAGRVTAEAAVELSWRRTAETIGLQYELHRGTKPDFTPDASTRLAVTIAGRFIDELPPVGRQHYALVITDGQQHSRAAWISIDVPQASSPPIPVNLRAQPLSGGIVLAWESPTTARFRYDVYRGKAGSESFEKLNAKPLTAANFADRTVVPGVKYVYMVRTLDRRDQRSPPSVAVEVVPLPPLPEIEEPVFVASFVQGAEARLLDGKLVKGRLHQGAKTADGVLELGPSGFTTFGPRPEFDLGNMFSVECWVRIEKESRMPTILSCGTSASHGWLLQRFGRGWRWQLGGANCVGGGPAIGRWVHLACTFNGKKANLYQDGKPVASVDCSVNRTTWCGPLVVGQRIYPIVEIFQLHGQVTGLKLYRRALRPDDVAIRFKAGMGN